MTGKEAARLRRERGYTQSELAELLGVSAPTVSRWEAAEQVPAEHLARLQKLAGVPTTPPENASRGAHRREERRASTRRPTATARTKVPTQPPPAPLAPPLARTAPAAAQPPQRLPAPQPPPVLGPDDDPELPTLTADEAGAVLLEGASLRAYWADVVVARELVLARVRQRKREEGRPPCRS